MVKLECDREVFYWVAAAAMFRGLHLGMLRDNA